MMRAIIFFSFFLILCQAKTRVNVKKTSAKTNPIQTYGFTGCPENNDFWTEGIIASPYYPNNYPNNIKCWYYMYAELGSVLRFNFTHFDLETCCDFVTIYDGYGDASPILAQFGGPNATASAPTGILYSSSRYALMTFTTDEVISQSGFQVRYDSVSTSTPCNRDILLVINGLSSVGTQDNFVKQLDFIANHLITNWTIGPKKTRVFINLQLDEDYAVVWTSDDLPTLEILKATVLGLTSDVPDVTVNNGSDFESLFRYGSDGESDNDLFDHRQGIEQIQITFVAQNPNSDQDFYEGEEFAHRLRDMYDTKVITVAMGKGIDVKKVGTLSYGEGFYFGADYDALPSLAKPINDAICRTFATGCGV